MPGIFNLFNLQNIATHFLLPFTLCTDSESPSFPGSSYAFSRKASFD